MKRLEGMKSPHVLLTDIGNVVIYFDLKRANNALAHFIGMDVQQADDLLDKSPDGIALSSKLLTGHVQPDVFHLAIQRLLDAIIPEDVFWSAFCDIFEPNHTLLRVYDHLRRTERIQRIIAVTDADPRRLKSALTICGFQPDAIVASYDVGCCKPDPRMFQRALEEAGVDGSECVYIDDLLVNIQTAQQPPFNIKGIHLPLQEFGRKDANAIVAEQLRRLGLMD